MRKLVALLLCMALFALVGCAKPAEQAPADTPDASEETTAPVDEPEAEGPVEITMAISLPTKSSQWWAVYADMLESAIANVNAGDEFHIEYNLVHNDSAADQVASVETQIIDQPDIMLMAPIDVSTSVAAVDACYAAGIPVATCCRLSDSENVVAARVYNEVQFAKNQLEAIDSDFPDGAKVVYLFGPNEASYAIEQYNEGFLGNIESYANIELLETFADKQDTQDVGYDLADSALAKYGDEIDAFAATNDGLALGAVQAIKAAGYEGEIKVYGSSALPQGMVAILEGNMSFTNMKSQAVMADTMIALCTDILAGNDVEEFGYVDPVVITKDNVETVKDATFGGTIADPQTFDFDAYKSE